MSVAHTIPMKHYYEVLRFNDSIEPLLEENMHERVKSLIVDFYSPSTPADDRQLLNYAIQCDDTVVTNYLLSRDLDVNNQDCMGKTPLMMAVSCDNGGIVGILLELGADMNILDNEGKSALSMAIAQHSSKSVVQNLFCKLRKKCCSSEEITKRIIDAGCHDVYQAAYTQDAKVLENMLKQGFSVESKHPRTKKTALHIAAELTDVDSVKVLLSYGADVNALDKDGTIPLNDLCFCYLGHDDSILEIFRVLSEKLSPTLCINFDNIPSIEGVLVHGNKQIISMIFRSKLAFFSQNAVRKKTLLHYIAKNRNSEVIEELKLHIQNYNVDALDRNGESPLMYAVEIGNVKMVKFLLERGANPNCANIRSGATVLAHAYENIDSYYNTRYVQCIELLVRHGADIEVIFKKSSTDANATIFDAVIESNNLKRMNPVIAHLALFEKSNEVMKKIIRSRILSHITFKKYFRKCKIILFKRNPGFVTIFKLLSGNDKMIARYSRKKKFMQKLMRISFKQNLRSSYSYYFNILEERIIKIIRRRKLEDGAGSVVSRIFKNRLHADVLNIIIDYLTDGDLRNVIECDDDGRLK